MLQEMPAGTFALWRAYAARHPFMRPRFDLMIAQLTQLIANIHRDRRMPYPIDDFLPAWSQPEPKTPEQMMHTFALFAMAHNALQGSQ